MDLASIIILLSIGNVVGWLAAIYVKGALRGLIGHVAIATIGAFGSGYLSQTLFPEFEKLGMTLAAISGAVLLLFAVRFREWNR